MTAAALTISADEVAHQLRHGSGHLPGATRVLCYSRESTIPEEFEAMVNLGLLNSRMKDFYDIWLLSRQFDFNGPELAEAISLTFARRDAALSPVVAGDSGPAPWTAPGPWT